MEWYQKDLFNKHLANFNKHITTTFKRDTGKVDRENKQIYIEQYNACTIETFIRIAGTHKRAFYDAEKGKFGEEAKNAARSIRELVTTTILERTQTELIGARIGIFYLVNTSDYKDLSEVSQTLEVGVKPDWLNTKAGKKD